jgi:hypothetical protein
MIKVFINILEVLVGTLVVIALTGFVMALPVYFLWNLVIPNVFHLSSITYIQAYCLWVLATCLFKGMFSYGGDDD